MEGDYESLVFKNNEGLSLSELDQGFLKDSSLSALCNDGLLKLANSIVDYAEPGNTLPVSVHQLVLSPLNTQCKMQCLSPNLTITAASFTSPVEGKSSTPYERITFRKPLLNSFLDLSCIDLTTSNPSWEVSVIKPFLATPKHLFEYSKTWSPSYHSGPQTLNEISLLNCSGTPTPDCQKSCRVFTFQDLNEHHAVLELTDEQQKSLSKSFT